MKGLQVSRYTNEELRVKAQCIIRWSNESNQMVPMFMMAMSQMTGWDPNRVFQEIIRLSQLED